MLVYSVGNPREILKGNPVLDRPATIAFAKKLFPSHQLAPMRDADLTSAYPKDDDEIVIACFPGLAIVAAQEFGIDRPSTLPAPLLGAMPGHAVYLHVMHSVVDWFAFAVWKDGDLQRSLSLAPDAGVVEDIGSRLAFEKPYWDGAHPAIDPDDEDDGYPFAFDPLELGEAALLEFFGFQLEGMVDPTQLEPESIPLMRFKRKKPWWRFD